MIQLVPQLRVLIAREAVDFRKGIDALAALVRARLGDDPFSGALFVFRNRAGTALKLLVHDGHGYWLCTRRYSAGRLRFWPDSDAGPVTELAAQQLAVLLYNGDPAGADFAPAWRPLRPAPRQAAGASTPGEARAAHRHGTHADGSARTSRA